MTKTRNLADFITTGVVDGRDVGTDGTKLDSIELGATGDQPASEIKAEYESNTNTNAFTDAEKAKLLGIAANADVTDATKVSNAGAVMVTDTNARVFAFIVDEDDLTSDSDQKLPTQQSVKAYVDTKLQNIEPNATADQTGAEIKAAYEAEADTNAFTDAEKTKLSNIEASADVTDATNVQASGALMVSELTDEPAVKSLDQGVATTDSPTFNGIAISGGAITLDGNHPLGSNNIGIGTGALNASDLTGSDNSAVGYQALYSNTTGSNNSATGSRSLLTNTSGYNNTATGAQTLFLNTTGFNNTATGLSALRSNEGGSSNTSVGALSLFNNTSGNNNSAFGVSALTLNTTGINNCAVGFSALRSNITGGNNTAVGVLAAFLSQTGSNNVIVGRGAAYSLTDSSNNTFVGANAGTTITSGRNNTILGRFNGNQDGLDLRTLSNHVVLSNGVGLPVLYFDGNGDGTLHGNINGRDITADGTKLDSIESGATGDQTASEILTAIKTVDGSASGLDADLLDGQQGSYYTDYADAAVANLVDSAPSTLNTLNELAAALGDDPNFSTTVTQNIATKLPLSGGTMAGDITFNSTQLFDGRDVSVDGAKLDSIEAGATADQTKADIDALGIDADTLDGQHASSFAPTSHSHTFDSLTGKDSGTGNYVTNGYIVAGRDSGSVGLTVNDGSGNANVTFNHVGGVPDRDGNAGRIEVNVDSNDNAFMLVELESSVQQGVSTNLTRAAVFTDVGQTLYYTGTSRLQTTTTGIEVNGSVSATSFTGDGSSLTGVNPFAYCQIRNTDNTTNINTPDWADILFGGTIDNLDAGFTASADTIVVGFNGVVSVNALLSQWSVNSRTSVLLRITKNGTVVSGIGASGYIRNSNSHNQSSSHAHGTFDVSSGDIIRVQGIRGGDISAVVTQVLGGSCITVERRR